MSIYSCNISNVCRAAGSSSCATLSYISGKKVKEDRTGEIYQYGRDERVEYVGTILPESMQIQLSCSMRLKTLRNPAMQEPPRKLCLSRLLHRLKRGC